MMLGNATTQKARKKHVCFWCGKLIEIGERYERWRWKDSGELHTIKVHPECGRAWDTLGVDGDEVGFAEFNRGCTCEPGRCECGEERAT